MYALHFMYLFRLFFWQNWVLCHWSKVFSLCMMLVVFLQYSGVSTYEKIIKCCMQLGQLVQWRCQCSYVYIVSPVPLCHFTPFISCHHLRWRQGKCSCRLKWDLNNCDIDGKPPTPSLNCLFHSPQSCPHLLVSAHFLWPNLLKRYFTWILTSINILMGGKGIMHVD